MLSQDNSNTDSAREFSQVLTEQLLEKVMRPGQYLGNEWGARRKSFEKAEARLALAFPDLYELGMSNFGLKILYQILNDDERFLCDRSYAVNSDMEQLLRERNIPLWAWESRRPLADFELVGFSLQYELTYTNVLNMLDLAHIPVRAGERSALFPLVFGGGPSSVNPEPMAPFMDFFVIGDGERALPAVMEVVSDFKISLAEESMQDVGRLRQRLLAKLATEVPGVYVPAFYETTDESCVPKPIDISHLLDDPSKQLPERVLKQVVQLDDRNQPTRNLVPYLSLVHDRETLEVRRGCDRGCRFCQPGYTFLPVRERSSEDLLRLSKEAMGNSGHQEYSMLSLCVSDYTSLHESIRALNEEHSSRRSSLSFPSQRADRMNLELAEELKAVRKSGITLAPEAGTERLRAVINKGLSHEQIINAIEAAYQSGWASVKLYFMCCLPTERDEDLVGIAEILREATEHCRVFKKKDPAKYRRDVELTCTISNFVPKPFTPFQWFGQITPAETARKHQVLRDAIRERRMRNVQLNVTAPQISLLEAVISRGDRAIAELIFDAWKAGCTFDAWDDRFQPEKWHEVAAKQGLSLEELACTGSKVGSEQPWDIVHIGLNNWWLVKEWEKAMATLETAPCTENLCHACGVCTELETKPRSRQAKTRGDEAQPIRQRAVSEQNDDDHHPSLFFEKPQVPPTDDVVTRIRFTLQKVGDLRFISHLDLAALLTRALRRAFINVAYTQGFNPQPKLNLAAALPLFQQSQGEVAEVDLAQALEADEFCTRINRELPPEVQVLRARATEKTKTSLTALLATARYKASFVRLDSGDDVDVETLISMVEERVKDVLSRESLPIAPSPDQEAKAGSAAKSPRDIRPGIVELLISDRTAFSLEFEIAHDGKLFVKPSELLGFLQPPNLVPKLVWRLTRLEMKAADGTELFTA